MADHLHATVAYFWTALWVFWVISALAAKQSVKRQSFSSRLAQTVPVIVAFSLLFSHNVWPHWLHFRFFPKSGLTVMWIGMGLTAVGIAFALWARLWIGRNWSGTVTIKDQHELIQRGPYSLVRHPIYTGLLLAFLGTALVHGEVSGLIGFLLLVLGFGFKLRMEETFMVQQFGSTYLDYKHRVKALVPFLI
jgi:protein-S-isoprenylcysteine O-methyltransferase Ste14